MEATKPVSLNALVHVERRGRVREIALARPDARNALSVALIRQLDDALADAGADDTVLAVVLHGAGAHFAAGADIKEMLDMTPEQARASGYVGCSRALPGVPVPVIAAVEGYALGGGCELVEMADIVVAAENAAFGHPEVSIGTMSGAGGIQRLVRALGKAWAMDVLLAGRRLSASEACSAGLVSRVVPAGTALEEARRIADRIARLSRPAVLRIKQAAATAYDQPLRAGLQAEQRLFHETLGLNDRMEGMRAFVERRPPRFSDT